jgi:hypothetical protein
MTQPTVAERLALTLPTDLADCLRKVKIADIIAGLRPRTVTLTGLTSAAAQVMVDEDGETELPGLIASVNTSAPANLVIIHSGAVGAGEVKVEYDAEGLATLTFEAAVTAFSVTMITIPAAHATTLAGEL